MTGKADATVLAINSGSSTLKYGLYRVEDGQVTLLVGRTVEAIDGREGLEQVEADLQREGAPIPDAIGHRIVHGGPHRVDHCIIDDDVLHDLDAACAFAPVHGPAALALMRSARSCFPGVPQVACFDTAFHATMPDLARTLPIPRDLHAAGIRRYGFHGLSCQSIVRQFGDGVPARLIIAHLGSGASVTAVRDGRSIDTSMGLTPSGGVLMETRTGDLDPGVLLFLLRERELDAAALARMVDHASGMLGISGVSGDMRRLRMRGADARCDLAIRMFQRSVSKAIAAMVTSLGGGAVVVLTGGIGENDSVLAQALRRDLAWIPDLAIRTLPSRENEEIARTSAALVSTLTAKSAFTSTSWSAGS